MLSADAVLKVRACVCVCACEAPTHFVRDTPADSSWYYGFRDRRPMAVHVRPWRVLVNGDGGGLGRTVCLISLAPLPNYSWYAEATA